MMLQVEGLLREVAQAESKWKLKEDSVLLMLKKVKEGEEWDTVTRVSSIIDDRKMIRSNFFMFQG